MSVTDEIKARIDILDLVSETVNLRRSGKNYTGFCPFHPNTRTPAFYVFPDTGSWHCFGECNQGGDIFTFIMKKEGWDFPEALRFLAERAGVELKARTPQDIEEADALDHLRRLLDEAVTYYQHHLFNTPAGKEALDYLHRRGIKDSMLETFGIGYAPVSWDALSSHFRSKGYAEKDLLDAGLISERDTGEAYDRFRHRVMFPIRDMRGRMAGFGARILNPEDVPKYLNSPQTALFDKSQLLYGLDLARKAIRIQDQAVIVEGYLDVILPYQAGYTNVVSPMGTALNEHQLRLLKRLSRRIILALDSDAAGDKATLRGLQVARQSLEREAEPVFDARGLLGHEARLKADIRVAVLPAGLDPDELVIRNPVEWENILKQARPIVIHVMETLAAGKNLDDPKVKDEIAKQVLPLIRDVPSSVERQDYLQRLARFLHVDERAFVGDGKRSGRFSPGFARSRQRLVSAPQAAEEQAILPGLGPRHVLEAHILGILLRRPDLLYRVDRALQDAGLWRFSRQDFQRADYQEIFELLRHSLNQDETEPLHHVLNNLPPVLTDVADELLVGTQELDPNEAPVLKDMVRALIDLRRRDINQQIDHLRFQIEEAERQGDLELNQLQQTMLQDVQTLAILDHTREKYTTRG
jgi:DNA primase